MIETDPLTGDPLPKSSNGIQSLTNPSPTEPLSIPSLDDKDGLRALATQALVEIIATAEKTPALVGAIRELLDRIDGKPVQAVTQDVTLNGAVAHVHTDLSADLLKDQISRILKKRDNKLIDG